MCGHGEPEAPGSLCDNVPTADTIAAEDGTTAQLKFCVCGSRAGSDDCIRKNPSRVPNMNISMRSFPAFIMAAMLALLVGCASTDDQAGTGEYIDDTVITTKVKAAIFNDPDLKSMEINVETFKGVVQLSGFVNSQADISRAVSLARDVKGVKSVKNDMKLK
jgi:hypothetical protein